MDSPFVVTIRIDWYVSVYRPFFERYNSFSRVGFKSLQCAFVRYSSQSIAEMRLLIVIIRWICKLADHDMQICSQLRSLTYVDEDLRLIDVLKRIVTNNCDEHLFVRNF